MSAYRGKKVFVAMSGGVDSSVAALLLKQRGYDVVGVFMRCYNVDGCAEQDAEDARRVAAHLDIPFYVWDFEEEYKRRVVDYMIDGYRQGETPNPDVACNKEIKFGLFLRRALELGADYVATGHYVRLRRHSPLGTGGSPTPAVGARLAYSAEVATKAGRSRRGDSAFGGNQARRASESFPSENAGSYCLFTAKDVNKDQSYFLWTLTQEQLRHCLFPIGDYLKSEVREMARQAGLLTAEKKDSQGICFLGKVTLGDFLKTYIPEERGVVRTTTGEKIGEHSGAYFYTIGQRHGLNLGVRRQVSGVRKDFEPHYVAAKDVATNTLVVAEGRDNSALYQKEIELTNVNFIRPIIPNSKFQIPVLARVRYRQPLTAAILQFTTSQVVRLVFDEPQKFVAPGQSVVFYSEGDEILGGGVIMAD